MFWDDEGDSEWMQRLKNQMFLKMPVTNSTRDEAMPAYGLMSVIIIVVFLIMVVCSQC